MRSEKVYVHRFIARGHGPFPFDMLRYDGVYPVVEAEARRMGDCEMMHVTLEKKSPDREWSPTHGRWQSFGWIVGSLEDA